MPINPWTGEPYPYSTMGDFLQRGVGGGIAGAMQGGVLGAQGALGPLSQQFYAGLPAVLGQAKGSLQGYQEPGTLGEAGANYNLANLIGNFFGPSFPSAHERAPQQPLDLSGGTFESLQSRPPAGAGGLGTRTFQGAALPNAPTLTPPNVNVAALFDPIIAQLQDPEKVKGATKLEGLAQILGGAAGGAFRGLNQFQRGGVGSVLAGAGAGASAAATGLRREEQALELEHQQAVQRMQTARAGVLGQKAGAEIQLAQAVSDTANKQAELQFNRDVQASLMSQQQVQTLGDGRVMIQRFDPNTGQGTMEILDTTDPELRALRQAYLLSQIMKNTKPRGRDEPRIVMDGKEFRRSAIIASANTELAQPLQKESFDAALRAFDNPKLVELYRSEVEEYLTKFGSRELNQQYDETPDMVVFKYMYEKMLRDPGERAAMRQQTSTGAAPNVPAAEPTGGRLTREQITGAFK